MAEIFHPFEIGDRHTARVGIHIWDNHHAPLTQNSIGPGRHRPIGRLDDQTRLHAIGIVTVDNPFQGRWDQDITLCLQNAGPVRGIAAALKSLHPAMFGDPSLERLNVQTIAILHSPVPLNHPRDPRAILFS